MSKEGGSSISKRDLKKDSFQGRVAGVLGDRDGPPPSSQVKKGQSLGPVEGPSPDSGQSKVLDPAMMEKLKREIALKAESTRRKSLLAGEEVSSPKGESGEKGIVQIAKDNFAPENLEDAGPGTQNAVMESLRQKTLFSEKSPEPKVGAGEPIPVDPYKWLKSIKDCGQAFDLFRARYVPFGPYSELTSDRKQDVDGAIRILCNGRFSQCEFEICGIPKKGEDTRDPEIIRADYVEQLAARNKIQADLVQAARKASKGKKGAWRRFSLEQLSDPGEAVSESVPRDESEASVEEGKNSSIRSRKNRKKRLNKSKQYQKDLRDKIRRKQRYGS